MTVQDYPLGITYGATTPPYGTPEYPYHRGDDYKCPLNTPLVIGGQTIGLSGATGMTDGPHCHVQEWTGGVLNTRKPQNMFKTGRVHETGEASQWGKFITIANSDGWKTTYCHLNQINVTAGQVIGGNMLFNEGDAPELNAVLGRTDASTQVGKDWKNVWHEYIKPNIVFNEGDVSETNTVLGRTDADTQVNKPWKNVWHEYIKLNVPGASATSKLAQVKDIATKLSDIVKE